MTEAEAMKTIGTPSTDPNHIDYAFGTSFGTGFAIDNCIDAVIEFANGDVQPPPRLVDLGKWHNQFHAEKHPDYPEEVEEGVFFMGSNKERIPVDRATVLAEHAGRIQVEREYAIETLKAAAAGQPALTQLLKGLSEDIDTELDLGLNPLLTYDESGRPKLGWRVSGSHDRKKWVNFAALIIADRAIGKLTDVGRCHLESCGRFFRIERNGPGKPSRKYCPGTNHMERAHALASTARSQKKRQRDAAQKRRHAAARKK
jgi:hypothetical protein